MIWISFWEGELIFTLIWLLFRAGIWLRNGKIRWKREAQLLLLYVNLFILIRFTFFPFEKVNGHVQPLPFIPEEILPLRVNLRPFVQIFWYDTTHDLLVNVIGNIAMFIPTGIILPVLFKRLNRCWKAIPAGAMISLCIELIQLLFYTRATDVDDLILNTSGCIIGYMIYAFVRWCRRKRR